MKYTQARKDNIFKTFVDQLTLELKGNSVDQDTIDQVILEFSISVLNNSQRDWEGLDYIAKCIKKYHYPTMIQDTIRELKST